MSFDFAAVEPLSGSLFFYVPTMASSDSFVSRMYYIPVDSTTEQGYVPSGERMMQPVYVEDADLSEYAGKTCIFCSAPCQLL